MCVIKKHENEHSSDFKIYINIFTGGKFRMRKLTGDLKWTGYLARRESGGILKNAPNPTVERPK